MTSRREFIQALVAGSAAGVLPGLTLAAPGSDHRRFVLLILRGGLDGLAAVAPYGDPGYEDARRGLALEPPVGGGGLRDLDGFFALHPMLATLHDHYGRGELIAMHGVASAYRGRSHFDAQNVLEIGLAKPNASRQGWLNRALPVLGTRTSSPSGDDAMAIGQAVPLVLRGPESVGSWAPARLPGPDDDLMERLLALYGGDAFLGPRLDAALEADRMAGGSRRGRTRPGEQFGKLAEVAARLLSADSGPRIAVIETGGWDTHANQGRETGALAQRLRRLDEGLGKLAAGMGPGWRHTVVLVVTEFGRTVAMNGTRGTDHGTAGIALMLGGAVNGGRVVGDWPGLAPGRLHEGRDLAPATDLRSIVKGILRDHLGVTASDLESRVFPSSRAAPAASGLIRT